MKYIDGFVLVVPKKKVAAYKKIARAAGKVWKRHGALEYVEAVADDMNPKGVLLKFPKMVKAKPSETIFFSYIVYRSRKHRDAVNKKVMSDPSMKDQPQDMPFDMKRMAYGGFKALVQE
jgi:uncharacterized protein YbaA (DUF1428 family)